jgi:TATA-box binding protein (TBP) (component of TFIID and TFIIIB)
LFRKVQIQIQNVVATGDLSQRLDLDLILRMKPEAKYEPEKFPGLASAPLRSIAPKR